MPCLLGYRSPLRWLLFSALLITAPLAAADRPELERVVLQLAWYHQFQFAGYYAAKHQGYFREAGFEVEIRHGGHDSYGRPIDPIEDVVFGRADFGVSRSDLLIYHSHGLPVVVLANIMQRSPLVFLTLEEHGFTRLEEVGERPISVTLPDVDTRLSAETLASFHRAGLDLAQLNNHTPSWKLEDLLDGTTQLMPGYLTDAPYFLEAFGAEPVTITPESYGIDFYGDLLFTRTSMLEDRPERVEAFRNAALRGWAYALDNVEEVAELITEYYPTRSPLYDIHFLHHEAEKLRSLMQPELIEIGYINPSRWENIADVYLELDMIEHYDLEGFLYQPPADPDGADLKRLGRWALGGSALLLLAIALASYLLMINRQLRHEVTRRHKAEEALRELAEKDGLTGIDNRRLFEEHLQQCFAYARRHKQPLTLIMFDVDHFKQVNDSHGHLAGDRVLVEIARITQQELRTEDHFARYGGEEFAVLLPNTDHGEALQVAERIWRANRQHQVTSDAGPIGYSLSLGVASLDESDRTPHDVVKRADERLYQAKRQGRDCYFGAADYAASK
ncbi:diguanylate cyclase (GGDEF) domain-containing protein [Franzmannia pantelleriensis]|uniref:diguanylate cyclase n=1 Tax=Franzmannia pantelleriensis TaxID=48727 RepID=A0A1G9UT87_9GAMM|nr:GGDEF domain-containing protein [Halomonas pantelleriensis]SDM63124.1 diguanylate cyclase (GGDEF) domain-containing protein [Halomonas pantelleriensis]